MLTWHINIVNCPDHPFRPSSVLPLLIHPSVLLIHHSVHLELPFSFTLGLKRTSFTNPIPPVVSLLPPGLPPRTFLWTASSELLGF